MNLHAASEIASLPAEPAATGRGAARRALLGVLRLEWRRQLFTPRALWPLAVALLPVAITSMIAWIATRDFGGELAEHDNVVEVFAHLYHGLLVRVVLFFGCLALFLNLVRGEVEERTLHYLLLTPVRRPVLVAGKYLAAVGSGWLLFVTGTAVAFALVHVPVGLGRLLEPEGIRQLASYCGMSALGVVGYGSAFLLLGTLLRSPGYLCAVFFAWEWFEFLLPPLLKQLSVVHYIKALTPVPISEGPFALLADPKPAGLAVLQVLLYAAVAVAVAAWAASRSDLDYGKG